MRRHDTTQRAAEWIADELGDITYQRRPGATLALGGDPALIVIRKAIDAGLVFPTSRVVVAIASSSKETPDA